MLRNALRSHPRLAFPTESHFIPLLYETHGDPSTPQEAEDLGLRMLRLKWVKQWKLDLDRSAFSHCRSYREVVSQIFSAWAQRNGKPRWGDKTPMNVRAIPLLSKIFPDALFVHIIRDGRDVALSWMPRSFGPGNLYAAATQWREAVRAGVRAGRELGPGRYLDVRYEELTADPARVLRRICDFVGEPFDEAVLTLSLGARAAKKGTGLNHSPRIVASNTQKWKTQMSVSNRILFESVAGDLLSDLGYHLEGITRPIGALEALSWNSHHQAVWMFRRVLAPKRWKHARSLLTTKAALLGGRRS